MVQLDVQGLGMNMIRKLVTRKFRENERLLRKGKKMKMCPM